MHVSHNIHYPSFKKYLMEKEEWNECTWNEIAWPSFKIAFNKISSARQPTIMKMIFSCWCSNSRHFLYISDWKLWCFCDSEDKYWKHILSYPGLRATIKRNKSWNSLKASQSHFDIPPDIWLDIEHGINTYQERKETPRHVPPLNGSFIPRTILLNDTFASQSQIGWRNFLKGHISRKWGLLLATKRTTDITEAFERSMITSLWKHSQQLWEFRNDESQKGEVRSVAEYKQYALDDKIREACVQKDTIMHPMNPVQEQLFDIQIEELLIMPYNIREAWLQSASLHLQRAKAHDLLARGSENAFLLHFTTGIPPDTNPL
jgi:hypothetical protein